MDWISRRRGRGVGWEVTGSGVEPPKPITGQRRVARGLHVK